MCLSNQPQRQRRIVETLNIVRLRHSSAAGSTSECQTKRGDEFIERTDVPLKVWVPENSRPCQIGPGLLKKSNLQADDSRHSRVS